ERRSSTASRRISSKPARVDPSASLRMALVSSTVTRFRQSFGFLRLRAGFRLVAPMSHKCRYLKNSGSKSLDIAQDISGEFDSHTLPPKLRVPSPSLRIALDSHTFPPMLFSVGYERERSGQE